MKIVILQDRLRSGGTERQSLLLARAFAAAGERVTLLTFRPGGALAPEARGGGFAWRRLQPCDFHADWLAPGLTRALRREAPDIVLCMGRMANCYAGRIQRRLPGAAVVATMRTGKKLPWLFRRSLHRVRHIVANSRLAARGIETAHGVPAARISVIRNSLVFPPAAAEPAALSARPDEPVVLLNVAMFRPEKNQRELIELCAALPAGPAWQLWLAGDGPARAECERLAAARGLGDRVRFLGFQRDPSPLYRRADLAVLASRSESLSNFLCEAQAHGLPAVAYDVGGVGECFEPDRSGRLVANGDRAAFTAQLAELVADAGLRARFAAAARDHARAAFDPARQARAYLDLFPRLLHPSRP